MVETTLEGSAAGISADTVDGIEKNRDHPLYFHPSDTPGSVLTSVQLIRTENNLLWSRSMMINLRAKTWFLNTISEELLSDIVYASNALMV
ncbi:hypothetical protein KY284_031020 [Solanum tuberosum]|nr:hypothetical protein KY284_031020 [Solanum tuberosum]